MDISRITVSSMGESVVRWRSAFCVIWVAMMLALAPWGHDLEQRLQAEARIDGSESLRVDSILKEGFDSPFGNTAILTVTGIGAVDSAAGSAALGEVVNAIAATPGVAGALSYLNGSDAFFVGENGAGSFILVGLESPGLSGDAEIFSLRERAYS